MLENYIGEMVEMISGNSYTDNLDGYRARFINSPVYSDRLGTLLLEQHPDVEMVVVYSIDGKDKMTAELYSKGDFDVSIIAKNHGGEGDKHHAIFTQGG